VSALASRWPERSIPGQAVLVATAAAAAAIWVACTGVSSRHTFLHQGLPILLAPLVLWLFFSERYERTLAVLLLYVGLLDGVVKLSSGSNVATLGRDALLYAITLGAVVRAVIRRTPLPAPPFLGIVIAWVAVCLMQVANPADVSVAHAVASLRQHLEFVPLFFFGYHVLRSERRIAGLLVLLLIVGAANGVADLLQTRMTPAQLSAWGPGYYRLVHGFGAGAGRVFFDAATGLSHIRPPGLGGEDGFGGMAGLVALPGAVALLLSARRSARLGWLVVPAALLTITGIATSQSRLAVVASAVALLTFLLVTISSRRGLITLVLATVIAGGGYAVAAPIVSNTANRYASIAPSHLLGASLDARRSTLSTIPKYLVQYPLGAGIGSVGPASSSNFGGSAAGRRLDGEDEFTFLLVETGIPGLLVLLAFALATARAGLALRRVADPALQRSLMTMTAVLLAFLPTWAIATVSADTPTSPYLWLAGGCLAFWYGELRTGRLELRPRRLRAALAFR
jgi:hypothetical protein